jgi:hypothetical protein
MCEKLSVLRLQRLEDDIRDDASHFGLACQCVIKLVSAQIGR